MKRVVLEIHEGQIVRNFLENDLLELLADRGAETLVVTPGARVPAFVKRYSRPGVAFQDPIEERTLSRLERYEFAAGRWLCSKGMRKARRRLWNWIGEPRAARRATNEARLLREWKADVVVSSHISQTYGRGIVAAANRMGIPTIGNLNSWDNAWKGLMVRPDVVTCWSENNRDEICRLAGYSKDSVRIIGAPAFDSYFASDAQWSREDLCRRMGLDASRPILLFATLGQFKQQIDETNPLEVLLRAIDSGEIAGRPQVVLRMHPWSRDAYFKEFIARPDVTVSRYENYVPGLTWTPTREETILAGNLLKHSNVVISPGSTMCIEPAIFDTPTIVSVFNEYMPETFEAYFRSTWLNQHFGRLYQNDWVPILRSATGMIEGVNKALNDRSWYAEGRRRIREEFLGPLDGQASKRFAEVIINEADRVKLRADRREGDSEREPIAREALERGERAIQGGLS